MDDISTVARKKKKNWFWEMSLFIIFLANK